MELAPGTHLDVCLKGVTLLTRYGTTFFDVSSQCCHCSRIRAAGVRASSQEREKRHMNKQRADDWIRGEVALEQNARDRSAKR